jgi:hypothetical protein
MRLETTQQIQKINQTFGPDRITICSNNKCKYVNQCLRTKRNHINEFSNYYEFNYKADNCFRKRNSYEGKVRELLRF